MDLQSIHTLAIRACLLSLLSPSLCLWAQQTSSTPSLDELISQIATAEKKLVNVKLECEASEEERVLPTDPWKPTGVTISCTAWFNGLPKSKGRVDVHQETLRHEQGSFLQRSFSASFDGQTGRMVRHAAGAPGAMVEEKRAEILPSAPYNVASDYCALTTGTAFCLSFWATDQKATFSAWLKSVKAAGRAKLSVVREQYQGADCVRISVGEPNSGGTYWLDAEHGLAFRGYESATERKGHRWVSKRKVVTEIVEAAPGVWCPQRAFQEYYSPDTNRPRENRLLFHASKVIANDPFFDEGVFRAPIPSGYIVTDKILGTRYRMGLDDRALERQLDQLAESVRNPSSISTGAQHQDSNQADATTPSLAQEVRRDTAQELGATGVHGKANSRAWIYGLVLIIALAVSSLAVLLVRKRGTRVPPHAT